MCQLMYLSFQHVNLIDDKVATVVETKVRAWGNCDWLARTTQEEKEAQMLSIAKHSRNRSSLGPQQAREG